MVTKIQDAEKVSKAAQLMTSGWNRNIQVNLSDPAAKARFINMLDALIVDILEFNESDKTAILALGSRSRSGAQGNIGRQVDIRDIARARRL